MWAYHCPTRTLPPPLFLSLTLPYSLSRSLPGSCIFNPLSSSLSQGTRHVEQQLRFFLFFWGVRLFYDALAPTCCNRVRGTRRSLGSPKLPTKPHLPHARFSTCDLTFPRLQLHSTFQIRIRKQIENRIQYPKIVSM